MFNPHEPILLVGDDRGGVNSLKLSPNLRKLTTLVSEDEQHVSEAVPEVDGNHGKEEDDDDDDEGLVGGEGQEPLAVDPKELRTRHEIEKMEKLLNAVESKPE